MEMTIRSMTPTERMYSYNQSNQIMAQAECIGHLRADFGNDGKHFYFRWEDHLGHLNTPGFKTEFDEVINALRFDGQYDGMLRDLASLGRFCRERPDGSFGDGSNTYGYRVDTQDYSYMCRLTPNRGMYNLYCYCYARRWLDNHLEAASHGIRFITPDYGERFRIADGEMIRMTSKTGEQRDEVCRYIDDTHLEVGRNLYHICEFAELTEQNGITVAPTPKT